MGSDFHPLRQRAEVIAAIAAVRISHPLARGAGEVRQHGGRDRLPALSAERSRHALSVGLCLIARRLERRYALLESWVVHVGNSVLDSVVEPLHAAWLPVSEGNRASEGEPYRSPRSEERRVGKECVSTCRSRWSPYH